MITEPDPDDIGDTIDEEDVITVWRHGLPLMDRLQRLPVLNFVLRSHPVIWLGVVASGWLIQGASLQYYAIRYIPDYSDQQWLIAYGWFSKVVYGVIALTASGIIGWFVTKSVRAFERSSTVLAKLIVSIPIGIEYDKNALKELGGEIDILDEEGIASSIAWALTVLFVPLLVFDMTVFLWPDAIIAGATLVGIAFTGLLEFVFGRMAPGTKDEALSDRTKRMRVIFKMGPVVAILAFVLGNFLAETLIGWDLQVEVGNFFYGASYFTHIPFWYGLGCVAFAYAGYRGLKVAYDWASKAVKEAEEKDDVEGWHATPKRYSAWVLLLGFCGFASSGFILAFSAYTSACGGVKVRRDMNFDQEAVVFHNVTVNNKAVTVMSDEPWALDAPKNGRVRVKFDTTERAHGVVEFDSPKAARDSGMPSYKNVISDRDRNERTGLYHHVAEFEVAPDFYGSYRIVMRNAHVTPPSPETKTSGKVGNSYGRIATSDTFTLVEPSEDPFYKGWWGSLKAWWKDFWKSDDRQPPPREVIVRHETKPRPRGGSSRRCTSGCGQLPPVRVVPALRDEVAAARNRH